MEDCAWGPFNPLSHLESLTHTTFSRKCDVMAGGEASVVMGGVGGIIHGGGGGGTGGVLVSGGGVPVEHVPMSRTQNYPFFPCPQCGKSFRTRVTLSRHEKIHKGNAFPCPMCPKVFYQVSNVKYHVHAVHGRQYEAPSKGGTQAHPQAQAAAAVLNEFKLS
ncbi:hypothetical protein Pmani_030347 [Petrolisthes manimaculis]|uniref:C2H2-type domain-containing protein n=1 Tax=Petrolisthes manimaculis TaxID=1843537 RepID=A0AAE1TW08_9EUCA|nr:hypothetical protein Pmani_030347 [Petrolisthes manimaculis]